MPAPTVSVIVPARDAAATLPATLRALAAQEVAPLEVIVVDDGSTDATRALAEAAGARVLATAGGRGPGAARQTGVDAARGDVLAFTDADCVPDPGWLRAGLTALGDADLVQGAVEPERPPGPWDRTVSVPRFSGLFELANVLVRREAFPGFVAGLGARAGKELGEDVALGWRAARAGARIAFAPEARVRHAVFPRGPGGYVAERARLRFFGELARRSPELREAFLWRRWFLSPRSARADAALAGLAAAAALRRPALALAALPYLATVERDRRTRGTAVAGVEVAADVVSCAALIGGSVRARSAVL